MQYRTWAEGELAALADRGRLRSLRTFDARGPIGILDGARLVSFASNDYLGLSEHPAVLGAAHEAIDRWGTSATASRLVVGTRPVHSELEADLAAWKHTEAALVFPTGYAANLGVLTSLGGPDCLIVSDEVNHASIIDGCRLSRSTVAITAHNDVDEVQARLAGRDTARAIVVTDSVFSMDGDEAPVQRLGEVCARHGALLVLDDAHAVLGPDTSDLERIDGLELLHVVTLSKALGSLGGAVCGSAPLVDLIVNRARSLIFSTGLSPADAAGAQAALRIVTGDEGDQLRTHLRALIGQVLPGHPSPIVPIVLGEDTLAVQVSDLLLERGFLVPAIRPPTVPQGTARLRIALSASHTSEMLDSMLDALDDVLTVVGLDLDLGSATSPDPQEHGLG